MSRIRMVTRTITSTNATCLMVNTDDRSTFEQVVPMPNEYTDADKLLKDIQKLFSADVSPVHPVAIINTEVVTKLYGMTEQDFIKNARVMPDRKEN